MNKLFHGPGLLQCTVCDQPMLIDAPPVRAYFRRIMGKCPRCEGTFDWWDIVLGAIKRKTTFSLFSAIGAIHTLLVKSESMTF